MCSREEHSVDMLQDILQVLWRERWAWFYDLALTEITPHRGRKALMKGNSNRMLSNDSDKEYVGTDLHGSAI